MSRSITVESLPTTDGRVLETSVWYTTGGRNIWGSVNPRGYSIQAALVTIRKYDDGHSCRTIEYGGGTTVSLQMEAATRFNQRRLEQLAAKAKDHPKYTELRDHVLRNGKTGLVVTKATEVSTEPELEDVTPDASTSSEADAPAPATEVVAPSRDADPAQLDLFPQQRHAA